jgi:hypothetical protein
MKYDNFHISFNVFSQLAQFIKIQQNIEMGMGQVLSGCVQQVMDLLQHQRSTNKLRLLNNLYALTKWEASLDKTIIRYLLYFDAIYNCCKIMLRIDFKNC